MPGFSDYINTEEQDRRTKKFEHKLANSDEATKRKLEKKMLKPEKLPHYKGPKPKPTRGQTIFERQVKITFATTESMEIFKKHFRVSKHVEQSVAHPELLISFLEKLESGEITYDEKTRKINSCHCTGGSPLGARKQRFKRK